MLIDWFTVGAQALNFLVLVWLMKRFLYKPILNAIDARERRIAKELADADAKEAEAQQKHDEFAQKNKTFDEQRAALLSQATEEAKAERERLLDEARMAAADLASKRQETLRNEEQNLHQAIRLHTQGEVFAIARKVLADLAGASLEERIEELFIDRLQATSGKEKEVLTKLLTEESGPVVVRSAFDLPAKQRAAIQKTLENTFSDKLELRFETTPNLVGGIELIANGQKVAWSIADYLTSLKNGVAELLKEKDKPEAKAEPQPEATSP